MGRGDLRFDISAVDRSAAAFTRVRGQLNALDAGVGRVTRSVTRFAAAFGIGIGLVALPRAIRQVVAETAKIGDVAAKVGLTVTQLQSLRFAAEQTGVTTQTLDMAMQRFSRRIGEAANGTGELLKIVKANNLELRNADGTMRPLNDILRDYANLIKNAGSEQEQLTLAFKGFDSEGAALVNLLRDGAIGVDEFAQQFIGLGLAIDEQGIKKAKEFDAAWLRVSATLSSTFTKAVIGVVDEIDKIATAVDDFVNNPNFDNFMRMIGLQYGEFGAPKQKPLELTIRPTGSAPGAKSTVIPAANSNRKGGTKRDPTANVIAALEFEAAQLARTSDERRIYNELKRAGVGLDSEAGAKISRLVSGIAAERTEIQRAQDAAEAFTGTLSSGLIDVAMRGGKVSDVLDNIINQLANRALTSVLGGVFGSATGGGADGFGGFFASLFGGARADGGPVSAGRAYLIGERGPELFMPGKSGAIAPNRAMGGVEINVINQGGGDVQQRRSRRGGTDVIDIVVGAVQRGVADGRLDNAFGGRFGAASATLKR